MHMRQQPVVHIRSVRQRRLAQVAGDWRCTTQTKAGGHGRQWCRITTIGAIHTGAFPCTLGRGRKALTVLEKAAVTKHRVSYAGKHFREKTSAHVPTLLATAAFADLFLLRAWIESIRTPIKKEGDRERSGALSTIFFFSIQAATAFAVVRITKHPALKAEAVKLQTVRILALA
jgi:hypothetical protein